MSEPVSAHDRNLIVLSAGRSGSSLLVNYLNSNRQIHCHGEVLNSGHEIYGTTEGKTREELIRHVASFFQKRDATYLGAKFLTHQFDELDITVSDVLEVLRRPKVIALYRRSLLETYVSLLIAQETDTWYSTDVINNVSVILDLAQFHEFAEGQRRRWEDSMREVSRLCSFMCVSYEDLVSNRSEATQRIFSFLDLPATAVHSKSVRQNPGDLRSKIANYDSLPHAEVTAAASAHLELGTNRTVCHN
jgi:LPS sulfotransferase NodH